MKTAKELIIPFPFSERRVALLDSQFLYVPDQIEHSVNRLSLFPDLERIHTEFCSGTGDWIVDRAKRNPKIGWIAVERKFERAKKIWTKAKRVGLTNLMVVCSEGLVFTQYYSPEVSEVFVNFPDPWPKRRHHKHRIIQKEFIDAIRDILVPTGKATCVSDDFPFIEGSIREFGKCSGWHLAFQANEWPEYGKSYFQELWKSKGRIIHYLVFERKNEVSG